MKLLTLCTLCVATHIVFSEYRTFDGSQNNVKQANWGKSMTPYLRKQASAAYGDSVSSIAGQDRPSALQVSNQVFPAASRIVANSHGISDMLPYWGQFVAHDILLTGYDSDINSTFTIPLPQCSEDPEPCDGIKNNITLRRADWNGFVDGARAIRNSQSHYVDGSQIYGATAARAKLLRQTGFAYLKTQQQGKYMPIVDPDDPLQAMDGKDPRRFFAGDARANENPSLQSLHTLFVREHNRKVDEFYQTHPEWTDEETFQEARKWVVAIVQKITYDEYLPLLLGGPLPAYRGYDSNINAGVDALFMGASFRYGHSAINPLILRLNEDGSEHRLGHILLRDGFFNPKFVYQTGIDSILRGLMSQLDSEVDAIIVDDLRKFMKQPFDLVAVNIMRGRDVGIPSYNDARIALGLSPALSWADITSDQEVASRLQTAYNGDISQVDTYVGGLAEDHTEGSLLGPLFQTSIREQFLRSRDGDRFWYENIKQSGLTAAQISDISQMTLAKIIKLNTAIDNGPPSAFVVPKRNQFSWSGLTVVNNASVGSSTGTQKLTTGYEVSWNVTSTSVTFTLSVNYTGYFGIGFGSNGMINADIVICSPNGAQFTCLDYWSANHNPVLDTNLGGTNDISDVKDLTQQVGYHLRTLQFTRLRTTGDAENDAILTGSLIPLIYAYSNNPSVEYHGPSNRGIASLSFGTGSESGSQIFTNALAASTAAKKTYFIFHGLLMLMSFGVIAPLAIYISRHPAMYDNWLSWHKDLMRIVVQAAIFDIIVVSISTSIQGNDYTVFQHARIGFTLSGLMFLNLLLGYLSKSVDRLSLQTSKQVRKAHQWLGWSIFLLGMANCSLGLRDIGADFDQNSIMSWIFVAYSVNMLAFLLYYERFISPFIARRLLRNSAFSRSQSIIGKRNIPKFSWEEIHYRIEKGAHWIILKELIYDVEEFRQVHPGGHELLTHVYGLDASEFFAGKEAVNLLMDGRDELGKQVKKVVPKRYAHSRLAASELTNYVVGYVSDAFTSNIINNVIKSPDRWIAGTLTQKLYVVNQQVARPVYRFVFSFPDSKWTIRFKPGDVVQLRLVFAGRIITRFYTPSKLGGSQLELIIKIYEDGQFTSILDKVPLNAEVYFRGPLDLCGEVMNSFTDNGCFRKLGMVCGGTGLVPMLLTLEYYLQQYPDLEIDSKEVELYLVAVFDTEDELIAPADLKKLIHKFNGNLRVHLVFTKSKQKAQDDKNALWTISHGPISKEVLRKHLPKNVMVEEFQNIAQANPNEPISIIRKRAIGNSLARLDAQNNSRNNSSKLLTRLDADLKVQTSKDSPGVIIKTALLGAKSRETSGNFSKVLNSVGELVDDAVLADDQETNQNDVLRVLVCGSNGFLTSVAEMLYASGYDYQQVVIMGNHQSLYRPASIHSSSKQSKNRNTED